MSSSPLPSLPTRVLGRCQDLRCRSRAFRLRVLAGSWLLGIWLLGTLLPGTLLLAPVMLHAQAKPAVRHTVEGTVVNAAKAPVAGAIVYLENPKSLDIQSYLSDDKGYFHFSQISPQTDYEVWAEQNGVQSKHKFISQFSSHVHFRFTLKLIPGKKKFLGIF